MPEIDMIPSSLRCNQPEQYDRNEQVPSSTPSPCVLGHAITRDAVALSRHEPPRSIPFTPGQPGGLPKQVTRTSQAFRRLGASIGRNLIKLPFSPIVGALKGADRGYHIGKDITTRKVTCPLEAFREVPSNYLTDSRGRIYPPFRNHMFHASIPYGPKIIGVPLSIAGRGLGTVVGASAGAALMPLLVMSKPFRKISQYFYGSKAVGHYCSDGSLSIHKDAIQFREVVLAAHSVASTTRLYRDGVYVKAHHDVVDHLPEKPAHDIITQVPGESCNYIDVTELLHALKSQGDYRLRIHKLNKPASMSVEYFRDAKITQISISPQYKEFIAYFKNPDELVSTTQKENNGQDLVNALFYIYMKSHRLLHESRIILGNGNIFPNLLPPSLENRYG